MLEKRFDLLQEHLQALSNIQHLHPYLLLHCYLHRRVPTRPQFLLNVSRRRN